jgi:hypothetical protein
MSEKKPKFAMEFVGFTSMGSVGIVEATVALTPEYDLKAVSSTYLHKDGSRVLTLIFGRSDMKLERKGYSLHEEWKQDVSIANEDSHIRNQTDKEAKP